jgi:hypothetical protein
MKKLNRELRQWENIYNIVPLTRPWATSLHSHSCCGLHRYERNEKCHPSTGRLQIFDLRAICGLSYAVLLFARSLPTLRETSNLATSSETQSKVRLNDLLAALP